MQAFLTAVRHFRDWPIFMPLHSTNLSQSLSCCSVLPTRASLWRRQPPRLSPTTTSVILPLPSTGKRRRITEKEAKGLWAYVDHDKSGLVSIKEFQHACYLLILDDWPRLARRTLTRLCGIINDAAVHEYSKEGDGTSSGNWFKIFGHFDTDESGRLGWEELEQVSRRRDPGLNLSEEKITLNELRGLWRAIDIDCSGDVTVDEFMHFMKKNATQQLHSQWRKEPTKKKEDEESRQDKIKRLAEALNRNRKPRKPRKKPDYLVNSKFAKQLQIAQWRKRDTERKIRATLEARSAEAERDFVTRFVQPPSLKEEARRAVILDELSKPLAVDVDPRPLSGRRVELSVARPAAQAHAAWIGMGGRGEAVHLLRGALHEGGRVDGDEAGEVGAGGGDLRGGGLLERRALRLELRRIAALVDAGADRHERLGDESGGPCMGGGEARAV